MTSTGIEVTSVEIRIPPPGSPPELLCFANLVINDSLVLKSLRLVRSNDGRVILAFPRLPLKHNAAGFIEHVHPLNNETRRHLTDAVLGQYRISPLRRNT